MRIAGALASVVLIVVVLADGFESILQPRRVTRRYRLAHLYYRAAWGLWRAVAGRMRPGRRQATFLGVFGPLSLLVIFSIWVSGLITGFALLGWSLALPVRSPDHFAGFATYLYLSGSTFFTLGYGDITPVGTLGRILSVGESGLGFGFLAAMLSYFPTLFQAYSSREVSIALLDARAGSPPCAAELLVRAAQGGQMAAIDPFLAEWERWSAALLESQLSFPVLAFYRSQHDNQSWLSALATILDGCALLLTQVRLPSTYQAQMTFAIARHAAVDLALVLHAPAAPVSRERLSPDRLGVLRERLRAAGVELHAGPAADAKLAELRAMYEPFLQALGRRLLLALPPVVPEEGTPDNWQRSAWMRPAPGIGNLPVATGDEAHFS